MASPLVQTNTQEADMTPTVRTSAARRAPMDSTRKIALVSGTFYLITFVASIPAVTPKGK